MILKRELPDDINFYCKSKWLCYGRKYSLRKRKYAHESFLKNNQVFSSLLKLYTTMAFR